MVIVFDVNGTLLDARALEPVLRPIFGRELSAREWFEKVLQSAMATTLAGDYLPFGELAASVLESEALARKITLHARDVAKVQLALKSLPPYLEVKRALTRLRKTNFHLAVLTNSGPDALRAQMEHAELASYFEQALSIHEVRSYKPAPETYQFAARSLGVETHEILMVAAHSWDLLGAMRAGCRTAFIRRPGKALAPHFPTPDFVADDLADLAKQLNPAAESTPFASLAMAAGSALLALAALQALRDPIRGRTG